MNSYIKKVLRPGFKAVASLPINNPHTPFEIDLMAKGQKPTCIINAYELDLNSSFCSQKDSARNMLRRIEEGHVVLIGEVQSEKFPLIQVYAQKHKIEEGKELYARYYSDAEGYPELSMEESFRRIGTLLGYQENDLNRPKCNQVKDYLLRKTRASRLEIRHELGWEMGVDS